MGWKDSIERHKKRLDQQQRFVVVPGMISFSLVLVLVGHIFLGLNPRLGSLSVPMKLDVPLSHAGGIWLSVSYIDEALMIMSDDKKVFKINLQNKEERLAGIEKMIQYIQGKVAQLTLSAALEKRINLNRTLVVLSLDQSLKYTHLRPVLQVLAGAGIGEYAFETKKPLM